MGVVFQMGDGGIAWYKDKVKTVLAKTVGKESVYILAAAFPHLQRSVAVSHGAFSSLCSNLHSQHQSPLTWWPSRDWSS